MREVLISGRRVAMPVEDWLRRAGRNLNGRRRAAPPAALVAAKAVLDQDPTVSWTLNALAKQAGYSKEHFGVQFRKYFGVSSMAYLMELRLRNAARLLMDPEKRVGEISQMVGFDDPFYFSRQFRKRFGVSPRQWRARNGVASQRE